MKVWLLQGWTSCCLVTCTQSSSVFLSLPGPAPPQSWRQSSHMLPFTHNLILHPDPDPTGPPSPADPVTGVHSSVSQLVAQDPEVGRGAVFIGLQLSGQSPCSVVAVVECVMESGLMFFIFVECPEGPAPVENHWRGHVRAASRLSFVRNQFETTEASSRGSVEQLLNSHTFKRL